MRNPFIFEEEFFEAYEQPLEASWEFSEEADEDWSGEMNRGSADYVRWVQSSLNRILGIRLPVDGILGPETRNAIRHFQQTRGLRVDGIVRENTEQTLIRADVSRHGTARLPEYEVTSPEYTQCDFIDPRIDVSAQYALYQMLKADPPTRKASVGMLAAVKAGMLGGIYQADQRVPAQRAQRIGLGWWQLIPSGQLAVCITEPSSEPPIIAFKKSISSDRLRLGQALRGAWSQCGLPELAPPPPSGRPCPLRPSPPPPPECTCTREFLDGARQQCRSALFANISACVLGDPIIATKAPHAAGQIASQVTAQANTLRSAASVFSIIVKIIQAIGVLIKLAKIVSIASCIWEQVRSYQGCVAKIDSCEQECRARGLL